VPDGNRHDGLDPPGTLWEIKTDRSSNACGYPFMIGVVDPGYAAALIRANRSLPAASIAC
jgi:hypothetical protein